MKPFNLEKALAGAPVVTRDGRPVTQLTHFADANESTYIIHGVLDHRVEEWVICGSYFGSGEADEDLFMAEQKVWVNLYKGQSVNEPDSEVHGFVYQTREGADKGAGVDRIACVEIDAPEGWSC